MSPESIFSCREIPPQKREKGIGEQLDELLTFRAESLGKLQEKKKQEAARIREETKRACAEERAKFTKNDFKKINLNGLGNMQETVGRGSSVRRILFGMNPDIIASNGMFNTADMQSLAFCDRIGKDTSVCREIRGGKQEKIQLSGTIPIHFRRNLEEVWDHKIRERSNVKTRTDIQKFYDKQVRPYVAGEKNFTKISRAEYDREVRESIKSVRKEANMEKGFTAYGISSPVGMALARALEKKISEADLIALGLTELMDKNNPTFNNTLFTTLLENVGKEYLLFSPALGDNMLSYGPYQLTYSAVNGKDGSATMADDRFTNGQILKTRNITEFPLTDHHKAAYLTVLNNLALLVRTLGSSEYSVISGKGKNKKKVTYDLQKVFLDHLNRGDQDILNLFAEFIAAAHNRPESAKKGVVNWLKEYCRGDRTSTMGGHVADFIPKTAPPTVKNNAEKQTGGKREGEKNFQNNIARGNRGVVAASL